MKIRKIAIFTGNRAEYGLQFPIIEAISKSSNLDYRLLVSGAHLDENFGNTLKEIENDGFQISHEIKINLPSDDLFGTTQAIGSGVISISKALQKVKPDFFVVYADRFEGFSALIAGTQMNIPTAHIEGGDITEGGALDDSVRHAMTKLAHIHFTTNKQASNRIISMGEEKWRVKNVGFPAIDLIKRKNYATPKELQKNFGVNLNKPIILFTQHSVTTEFEKVVAQIKPCLDALVKLNHEDIQIFITYPNNDAGGVKIIKNLELLRNKFKNINIYKSLGRYNYHGFLSLALSDKYKVVCVGNSSSGIKETPAFKCPTVNIGSRQKSRLRGSNVIDVNYDEKNIYKSIKKCLFDSNFRKKCRETINPYGKGNAGIKISKALEKIVINKKLLQKKMTIVG